MESKYINKIKIWTKSLEKLKLLTCDLIKKENIKYRKRLNLFYYEIYYLSDNKSNIPLHLIDNDTILLHYYTKNYKGWVYNKYVDLNIYHNYTIRRLYQNKYNNIELLKDNKISELKYNENMFFNERRVKRPKDFNKIYKSKLYFSLLNSQSSEIRRNRLYYVLKDMDKLETFKNYSLDEFLLVVEI